MSFLTKSIGVWRRFPLWQMLLIPVVFAALGVARLCIVTLPFATYAPVLGPQSREICSASDEPRDIQRVAGLSRVLRKVARRTPWTSNCLPQAMVAAWLLRRYRLPYVVHMGVRRDQTSNASDFEAHAWVLAGSVRVAGVRESVGMTIVGSFVWPLTQDTCTQDS